MTKARREAGSLREAVGRQGGRGREGVGREEGREGGIIEERTKGGGRKGGAWRSSR